MLNVEPNDGWEGESTINTSFPYHVFLEGCVGQNLTKRKFFENYQILQTGNIKTALTAHRLKIPGI